MTDVMSAQVSRVDTPAVGSDLVTRLPMQRADHVGNAACGAVTIPGLLPCDENRRSRRPIALGGDFAMARARLWRVA